MKVALGSGAPHRSIDGLPRCFPVRRVVLRPRGCPWVPRCAPRASPAPGAVVVSVTDRPSSAPVSARCRPRPPTRVHSKAGLAPSGRRRGRRPFEQPARRCTAPAIGASTSPPLPGTPVRAANDGSSRSPARSPARCTSWSRTTAGCARRTRSSPRSPCTRAGDLHARRRRRHLGGAGDDDHDGAVLHFGLRVGDRYVDPMLLFRPDDLTKLVRLVPTDRSSTSSRGLRLTSAVSCQRRCTYRSRAAPRPERIAGTTTTAAAVTTSRSSVVSSTRRATSAAGSATDRARRSMPGLDVLDAVTDVAGDVLDGLRVPLRATLEELRSSRPSSRPSWPRTPIGHARARRRRDRPPLRRHRHRRVLRRRARRPTAPGDRRIA